jgi:hypothetical protein
MAGPRLENRQPPLDAPYKEGGLENEPQRGMHLPMIGAGRLGGDAKQAPATDDWPFVYMPVPAIPTIYLASLGMIFGIAVVMLFLFSPKGTMGRFDWHMFFLGSAFMLLETRSLVTFGLLFGTTWMVNSLVFFAILSSVLLAIVVNRRFKMKKVTPLYIALFATLLLNYLVPLSSLLGIESSVLRYALASIMTFAPIFVANVVFSRSFRDTESADIAFASNLLGIMLGGMFEYSALLAGYRFLVLLVIAFYAIAFVFWRRAAATESATESASSAAAEAA